MSTHLHMVLETVKRLLQDPAFRQLVAHDPEMALVGAGFSHEECQALAALSNQPRIANLDLPPVTW